MRVAMPVSGNQVAPIFEQASRLLVTELLGERVWAQVEIPLLGRTPVDWASELARMGVNTVLCGAASKALERAIEAKGIELFPGVTGRVDEVLRAYSTGTLDDDRIHRRVLLSSVTASQGDRSRDRPVEGVEVPATGGREDRKHAETRQPQSGRKAVLVHETPTSIK